MKKILWFSRHAMSMAQYCGLTERLGPIEVTQLSGDAANVHVPFEGKIPESGMTIADTVLLGPQKPLKELVLDYDEVAAVLPIGMQQQILPYLPAGRLLIAKNGRLLTDGGKVDFVFQKWEALTRIDIVMEDLKTASGE